MAALDSSMLFFLPFGIDGMVVYLSARNRDLFWLYPVLATIGSVAGAAVTFWIGKKAGEAGLERLVPAHKLQRVRARVRHGGAIALAMPALMPPPFPLTPFILTCGALDVSKPRFFVTFAVARLVRFGSASLLARAYGSWVLQVLQADAFRNVIIGFVVVAAAGTIISAVLFWRHTHAASLRARPAG